MHKRNLEEHWKEKRKIRYAVMHQYMMINDRKYKIKYIVGIMYESAFAYFIFLINFLLFWKIEYRGWRQVDRLWNYSRRNRLYN